MARANMAWDLDMDLRIAQIPSAGLEEAHRAASPRKELVKQLTIQVIESLGQTQTGYLASTAVSQCFRTVQAGAAPCIIGTSAREAGMHAR
eukprot:8467423-Alexandrium_andersonii.AAC.1